VADKWLTFDCYGTVADWNACMSGAIESIAGLPGLAARRLLTAYHQAELELEAAAQWQPTMPPVSTTPSVPWRRASFATTTAANVAPSLVIDDADPDRADRERDERDAAEPHRVSFLPPILLDREDRSARQGGLTLAVIILLIAATLTLSYLMRRPSASGDGVTMATVPASLIVG